MLFCKPNSCEHNQLNPYNWLLDWVLYFYIHNSMCRYTLINYWLTLTSSSNKPEVAQTEEICTINRACSAILTWIRITIVFTVPHYFSYILVASFIGGGNRRKPPTGRKLLIYFITYCCIEYTSPWTVFTLLVKFGVICRPINIW
jgi:hypothetical protein